MPISCIYSGKSCSVIVSSCCSLFSSAVILKKWCEFSACKRCQTVHTGKHLILWVGTAQAVGCISFCMLDPQSVSNWHWLGKGELIVFCLLYSIAVLYISLYCCLDPLLCLIRLLRYKRLWAFGGKDCLFTVNCPPCSINVHSVFFANLHRVIIGLFFLCGYGNLKQRSYAKRKTAFHVWKEPHLNICYPDSIWAAQLSIWSLNASGFEHLNLNSFTFI